MRIKQLVLALLFVLGAASSYAIRLQSEEGAEQGSVAEQKPQPAELETKDSNRKKPSRSSPVYKPSERIEADSAVSFPVDI